MNNVIFILLRFLFNKTEKFLSFTFIYFYLTKYELPIRWQAKCELYWPDTVGQSKAYAGITVRNINVERFTDYTVRHFSVTKGVSLISIFPRNANFAIPHFLFDRAIGLQLLLKSIDCPASQLVNEIFHIIFFLLHSQLSTIFSIKVRDAYVYP